MAKSKLHQKTRAPKARAEQPVSAAEIRRAAERAGIDPQRDDAIVSMLRGDARYVVRQLQLAFDDVLDVDTFPEAERDLVVLRALRRLRTAQGVLESGMAIGGES
jgi:hypothetical protein